MNVLIRAAVLTALLGWGVAGFANEPSSDSDAIAADVEVFRAQHEQLTKAEREQLYERRVAAAKRLSALGEPASRAIRAALEAERDDHFFAIGLAGMFLQVNEYSESAMRDLAPLLRWVDPNHHPNGFFSTAFSMARRCGEPCLPTVLKMLELERLDYHLTLHAMRLDIRRGLEFAIGVVGDRALPAVVDRLDSPSCTVRANAARSLGFLIPLEPPDRLYAIARAKGCPEARDAALVTLGAIDPPDLSELTGSVLAATPASDEHLQRTVISALAISFNPAVLEPLEALAKSDLEKVAADARRALEVLREHAPDPGDLARRVGSAAPRERAEYRALLETTEARSRYRSPHGRMEALTFLGVEDLPLLNRARASVLKRLSDECLYEYRALTYIARSVASTTKPEFAARSWHRN